MEVLEELEVCQKLGEDCFGDRDCPVFLPFSVMDRQDFRIEVEALHAQAQAFEKAQPATVQELHHQVVGRHQVRQDCVDFFSGEHNGHIGFALCSDYALHLPEFPLEYMAVEEKEGVECLVLG